jgi:hypothetical protein
LLEEYSEVPVARRVCNHPVHDPTELALLYFVGALAEAPAWARFDSPADRMTSAAAMVTRLLLIASSSCSRRPNEASRFLLSGSFRPRGKTLLPNLAVCKN